MFNFAALLMRCKIDNMVIFGLFMRSSKSEPDLYEMVCTPQRERVAVSERGCFETASEDSSYRVTG